MLLILMKELLRYKQQRIKTPELYSSIELVGDENLLIIALKLVDWIKVEGMRKKTRNLDLWPGTPWCESLKLLIEQIPAFSQSFKVIKNYLTYNDAISEEERQKTIAYIAKHNYTAPPLITYYRNKNNHSV